MPIIPSLPRLSIIVPVGNDVSAFEDTLVSVLENQPVGSEILVAHDGSYDDRFDLEGEVRFVTEDASDPLTLIAEAAEQSRGRFVHVLMPGLHGTRDWADHALEQFERADTAAVTPIIRDSHARIVAAGWRDRQGRLFQPIAVGGKGVDQADACSVQGPYLQASFWRREVLCGLLDAFQTDRICEASYAAGRMLLASDWRCTVANGSEVTMRQSVDLSGAPSYRRGQRFWAIKKAVDPTTSRVSWTRALKAILTADSMAETIGQIKGPAVLSEIQSQLDLDLMPCASDHGSIIRLPERKAQRKAA